MQKQINTNISEYLLPFLRGCRIGFTTQQALNTLIEKWRRILHEKCFGGTVLMDLSKAFGTLNHDLLFAKLHAYGFD